MLCLHILVQWTAYPQSRAASIAPNSVSLQQSLSMLEDGASERSAKPSLRSVSMMRTAISSRVAFRTVSKGNLNIGLFVDKGSEVSILRKRKGWPSIAVTCYSRPDCALARPLAGSLHQLFSAW